MHSCVAKRFNCPPASAGAANDCARGAETAKTVLRATGEEPALPLPRDELCGKYRAIRESGIGPIRWIGRR
jgi:hypothetical protein